MDTTQPSRIKTVTPSVFRSGTPFVTVEVDAVEFPNGTSGTYASVTPQSKFGAVGIVRRLYRGLPQVALVRQHRYPIDQVTWEFPRGSTRLDAEAGMRTELVEELGFNPGHITQLGTIRPDTGLLTTSISVFHAVSTAPVIEHTEEATGLQAHWVSQAQFLSMVRAGEVTCGITLAAWALLTVSPQFVMPGSYDL